MATSRGVFTLYGILLNRLEKLNFGRTYLGKSVNYMTYFSRGNSEFGAPEVRLRGPGKE